MVKINSKDRSPDIPNRKNIMLRVILLITIILIIFILYKGYTTGIPGIKDHPVPNSINTPLSKLGIPGESEWEDQGIILKAGDPGSWDFRLNGMISPCLIIKKNGTYFLYYVGSDGDRGHPHNDGGPRHRKLGVATSSDGINFVKYSGNPILTFSPNGNEEEGIFSAGGFLDDSGEIILYYGAMDAGSSKSTSVDGDIRLAVSNDGFDFTDIKDVVSHSDSSVWGFGDELFPLGAFYADEKYHVYYTLGGHTNDRALGIVCGENRDSFTESKEVIIHEHRVDGGCNPVYIGGNEIALFIAIDKKGNGSHDSYIEIRTAKISDPSTLSKPQKKYDFGTHNSVVFYDQDIDTWFMYYLRDRDNSIRLKMVYPKTNISSIS
ncbi:MAG: hypothetical protein KAJ93_05215 [Methanosarcinales archaeon]|nr:hypothetical protein [Methanosarcinales archaeon]